MILINLLPHRAAARKRKKEQFAVSAAVAAVCGCLLAVLVNYGYQRLVDDQVARNALLERETALLDAQIKDIAGLRTEIQALKARQEAVENLQSDRNTPVHLLRELVAQTPDGVHLSTLKQDGQSVLVSGVAQSQERVSELLRNLSSRSEYLKRPELVEIVTTVQTSANREQKRVATFTLRVQIARLSDAAKDIGQQPVTTN